MLEINKIHQGDCLELMKELPDNIIDSVITDPPYGLSFMGKKWDYDVPSVEVWKECLRVLKPGGHLLSFAGTRTQHRMAVNIEDAGFEIRDMIAWVYGSGFPKSLNIGKQIDKLQGNEREVVGISEGKGYSSQQEKNLEHGFRPYKEGLPFERADRTLTKGNSEWEGWGTALKPALEPITVARKPLSEKTVALNVLKWGTGGLNIDDCRISTDELTPRNNNNTPSLLEKGFEGKPQTIKPNSLGRFPANFIHDGSDEVKMLFPQTKKGNATGYNFDKSLDANIPAGCAGGTIKSGIHFGDSGSASRFFYCAKASKSEREFGCEKLDKKSRSENNKIMGKSGSFKTGSGNQRTTSFKNNHPTVKPIKLMKYLVKLITPVNGVVLDLFIGSGTTAIACKQLNRNFIGMEKEIEYVNIAKARLGMVAIPLFAYDRNIQEVAKWHDQNL